MATHWKSAIGVALRSLWVVSASLALASGAVAQGRDMRAGAHGVAAGHWHGGHFGPGYGHRYPGSGFIWGGVGLGIGLGLGSYYAVPWYVEPDYVVVDPGVTYGVARPVPAPAAPQPLIYPRNGQTAAQMQADSDACSQWAGAQPNATVDASVFRRGISACMDARGYTLR